MALRLALEHVPQTREEYDKSAVFINEHLAVAR